MSTHKAKVTAADRWPRMNSPLLDVTGLGLAKHDPSKDYTKAEAMQLNGIMLSSRDDPETVGKVVGMKGFRDHNLEFYGLQVMWTKNVDGLQTKHTTLFRNDLLQGQYRCLEGREANKAERMWAASVARKDLALGRITEMGRDV